MPTDYKLENFKEYAQAEAMKFGDFADEIKELLIKAYNKGYDDCADEYHTFCGL